MVYRILWVVTLLLVVALTVPQTAAQSPPRYCDYLINECHGNAIPDGGVYAGFTGSLSEQRAQWTQFCFAVQNAETCLAQIPAECLQSAITNRIHHIGVCTLEYSDFLAGDECTDEALVDQIYEGCSSGFEAQYMLRQIDACSFLTGLLGCANDSFTRHCGDLASLFGSIFTQATAISHASDLPRDCQIRLTVSHIELPPSVEHCEQLASGCISTFAPTLANPTSATDLQNGCANLGIVKSCFTGTAAMDAACSAIMRRESYYYSYICSKTYAELIGASSCIIEANPIVSEECSIQGSTLCVAYVSFVDCLESVYRRTCSSHAVETAIELAAVIFLPPLVDVLPANCPLHDRLPNDGDLQTLPGLSVGTVSVTPPQPSGDEVPPNNPRSTDGATVPSAPWVSISLVIVLVVLK